MNEEEQSSSILIATQRGALPILLTAPHGGYKAILGASIRKKGCVTSDLRTLEFTQLVNEELIKLTGEKPYLVLAEFQRKYLDVNRMQKNAMDPDIDNQAAECIYHEYHRIISTFTRELKAACKNALLIDVHGQGASATTIFRGTSNLKTVSRLIDEFGIESMTGNQSICGLLQQNGYSIDPAGNQEEDSRFGGGYTVRTYGSHQESGINAIQLELGSNFRFEQQEQCARDLAKAIVVFSDKYLRSK